MRRALELAEGGRGRVSPNPLVGAVIVARRRGDRRGLPRRRSAACTPSARRSRTAAERGEDPAGATMYVTLEPCAHQGRQPPCVEAILEAGIARVVIASDDPTEKAAGRGPGHPPRRRRRGRVRRRRGGDRRAPPQPALPQARPHRPAAGHPEAGDVARRPHRDRARATRPGSPASESRALVHRWRAESDAIAVGIGTVLADDPLLTARDVDGARQPLRVVFDRRGPPAARLAAARAPSSVAPVLVVVVAGRRRRAASTRCATPAPRSLVARRRSPIARPSPSSAAAASPASSSRAAATLAAAFAAAERDRRGAASSSPRSCCGGRSRQRGRTRRPL